MPQNKFFMNRFYVLFSCFFWIVTSFFFFLKWHDPTLLAGTITIWIAFAVVLFVSCLIGLILSVPVLYVKTFFSSKIVPIFFLVFIHFFFLILNLGVAPGFSRYALNENSIIFKLSSFFYEKTFKINLSAFDADWMEVGKKSLKNSEYIFSFDEDILNKNKSYPMSKSLLKNDILLVSTDTSKDRHPDDAISSSFLNRFAASQPQFMLFYRLGFAGIFQKSLQWKNIDRTNFSFLKANAKEILSHKIQEKKHLIFLSKSDSQDDIYLSHVIKDLLSQQELRILILSYFKNAHDLEVIKSYSNWIEKGDIFFYEDILKDDIYNNEKETIDCRLENEEVSRFLCIFERKKMYVFSKKMNFSRKEYLNIRQKNIFSQLFSVDRNILKKNSHAIETENIGFLNQFDIYTLVPSIQNKLVVLSPSERGRFIKENDKKISDIFDGLYR